jgi:DNA polymerase I
MRESARRKQKNNNLGRKTLSTSSVSEPGITEVTRSPSALENAVAAVKRSADPIALDLETTGVNPRRDDIRLAQVLADGKIYVIDAFKNDLEPLISNLAHVGLPILAHNAAFEYGFVLAKFGVTLDNMIDTYLYARLAACGDMRVDCDLGAVSERELGVTLDKAMQTSDWTNAALDRRQLNYAAMDVKVLRELHPRLWETIEDQDQERVAKLEMEALPAVARMRFEGLPLDRKAWEAHATENAARLEIKRREMLEAEWLPEGDPVPQEWALQGEDCLAMLRAAGLDVTGTDAKALKDVTEHELVSALLAYRKTKGEGREEARARVRNIAPKKPDAPPAPWNFGSPAQVSEIAYKILGFYPHSTDEASLLRYVEWHPFFRELLDYRKLNKLVSTYGMTWFKDAYDEERGRLYPGWRQIGTSTGRFSCSVPNVQNLPRGGPYRSFFKAPPGRAFVGADYSQIEVRVYAKIVREPALLAVLEKGLDAYRATAAGMLGKPESEVTDEERQKAKAIVLGLLYGLSASGLPAYAFKGYGVEIAPDEAKDLIGRFFDLYPAIAEDHEAAEAEVEDGGSADRKTLTGRRRDGITARNEAINMPIQGTAADGLKLAMGRLYRELSVFEDAFIVGAFHDELLIECNEGDAETIEKLTVKVMLEAMDELLNAELPKVRLAAESSVSTAWEKG